MTTLHLKLNKSTITIESYLTQPSAVYFAREKATGYIKIGGTSDFKKRLSKLHADNALGVEAIATIPCSAWNSAEQIVQHAFSDWRVRGEWFDVSPQLATEASRNFVLYWACLR